VSTGAPTLGVVAIAKNEELDMPGFLRHLQPWVDEIVIVDDASTDRTAEIVRAAGENVKLIAHRMTKDGFSGQRNAGIAAATSEWLLHMDIDERVTPQLAAEIESAIGVTRHHAYRYRRLNFFLHRPMRAGGWQYWNNPQLARRGKHQFRNVIHEACVIEGGEGAIGQLEGLMWHLNDEDYVERVGKNLRYMQFSGDQILERGFRIRWYHILFHPLYRACKSYFLERGFTAGTRGLIFALHTFAGTFNWWAYAWDRQNRLQRDGLDESLQRMWDESSLSRRRTDG